MAGDNGAPSSPRDGDISPRKMRDSSPELPPLGDRTPPRWDDEEERGVPGGDIKEERMHDADRLHDADRMHDEDRLHDAVRLHHGGGGDGTPAPYSCGSDSRSDGRHRMERRRSYDRGENDEDRGNSSLLIRHLKFTTAPTTVRTYFESIGPVKDVYLPLEFETGRPRGFGFVEFQHATDAAEALRTLNDTELDGSCISISFAQHGRKTPSLMRARSSGYGRGGRRGGYDRGRRPEPYSAPDRYDRSPPPRRRYADDRLDDRSRGYDRYSSRSRGEYDAYYSRDSSPRGGPPPSDYDRRRF